MALVAYASSGESDSEDDVVEPKALHSATSAKSTLYKETMSGHISEDDDDWNNRQGPDLEDLDIPGLSTSKSLFSVLPQISKTSSIPPGSNVANFIDENEDLSTIPARKEYEKDAPKISSVKAKKGPKRIFAPVVLNDSDEEDQPKRHFISKPLVGSKSTLLSLIPAPKNKTAASSAAPSTSSSSLLPKPSSLVPRSVARPPAKAANVSYKKAPESSDEDDETISFFTLEKETIAPAKEISEASFKSKIPAVQATPEEFPDFQSCYRPADDEIYGSAIAPYPPPAPTPDGTANDDSLLEDQEAMQRIIGRKTKVGQINFVEVKNDDIKPDPRDWMVKALSEDQEGQPGPKNTIKGERKKKHQITYLAAMAKENEHVLKQQWSQNAHTRRATQSKYGF